MKTTNKKLNPFLRLSQEEIDTIKRSVLYVDPDATVYLFGSRTDIAKQGGDIDILIVSKTIGRKDISKIRWNFFEQFGEQKMDIVVDRGNMNSPFVRMIFPKAVRL